MTNKKLGSLFTLLAILLLSMVVALAALACGGSAQGQLETPTGDMPLSTSSDPNTQQAVTITLGAYTTPREVYGSFIIPEFQKLRKQEQNQDIQFSESYLGSGAQARAIIAGFEADVAALSLEPDITKIKDAGLISHDWQSKNNGIISRSIVVLAVRPGNPKGIQDWTDLAKLGIEILTPDPRTSGGAQWNIAALWGAALRGHVEGVPENDPAAAQEFLANVLKNVTIFDKGARESITNFESGIGDVAITYENEVITSQRAGNKIEYVIPTSTIVIENPAALIDTYVDKHGNRQVVEAFIDFLHSDPVQQAFAKNGYRPADEALLQEFTSQYPPVEDLWVITYLGGWGKISPELFGENAIFQKAIESGR
jgi:sulfate/thiosulfate transport system substrate-binding protein